MNLRFVETFLWVCRLGSFRAAAQRLGTTQAAVSNRIATLEAELGSTLFERRAGSVRLGCAICYDIRFPELFRALLH